MIAKKGLEQGKEAEQWKCRLIAVILQPVPDIPGRRLRNGAAREALARRYSTEIAPFRRGYSLRGLPGTSGKTGSVLPGLLYSGLRGEKAAAALWRL